VSAREIHQLRFVPFPTWFPAARDPRVGTTFYTVVQEDIYEALIRSQSQFREHRVIDLEILGNVVGADIRQYFTYLHDLLELLALPGTYCEQWVREFYASMWVSPDHSYIHLLTPFLGTCLGWQDKVAVRCLQSRLPMRMVADEGEVERD